MPPIHHRLAISTTHPIEIVDLTERLRSWVRGSGIRDGLLTVMSPHTTARITINERETELQRDMVRFLERLAPADADYGHNRAPVDDRLNAHSHLIGLFMNASESIPVADGELVMGGWQSLFFIELDGPRERREVHLHLMRAE
ncbi:MAG: YjbQ family protein [Gemmatimonadetes bacterium]|jgi:secondary thiamine-phosphate synthase enzyme|nr:YjbQ family protein [Gemmatimonadota bacterium]MCC7324215.1 YjbQ family protein [Gemmatimonadaceae bacterium]MBK6456879.1 YjbQ family protein [Gemmatimonadota bacterium]MBK6845019.1 YjbQ family protein [Gemmatimonadota bacterium]MBK7832538.1 YjbQ family protein [Gemmatimonadota bacterium]